VKGEYLIRTIICEYCKTAVTKHQPKSRRFCSRQCYFNYIKKNPPKSKKGRIKICLHCGKKFYVSKCNIKRKYCSSKCYHGYYNKYIKIKCLTCRKIIKIKKTPYNLNHLPKYCSRECCNRNKHIVEHHIDLNVNNNKLSNKLILTNSQHALIHRIAYHYLVEVNQIKNYIKWFKKKYLDDKK
jgi:hypothetical protein